MKLQAQIKTNSTSVPSFTPVQKSLQRSSTNQEPTEVPPIVHGVLRSPGQPLDPETRAFMEPRFGHDFSRVRVHYGEAAEQSARDVNANAYTVGHNIVFGAGRFAPGTHEGRRLLAHELVHVLQARAANTGGGALPDASSAGLVSRDTAESQATQMASTALMLGRVNEAPLPATGLYLDKALHDEAQTDAEILAILNIPVEAEDRAAQRQRIDRLAAIITKLPSWVAEKLAARLEKPTASDRLAQTFHYRLSTRARDELIGRLRVRSASITDLYSKYADPRKDANYIDKVIDQVQCMLIVADRYTLVWKGGRKVVFNADIDWTKSSTAMPMLDIHSDEAAAKATAAEWHDVAVKTHYDRVVTFYRGQGGVILPTWFSPETAPETYQLIMGVNSKVRQEAAAAEKLFRGLRNGMVVGMILGGVFRFVIRWLPGGGGGAAETSGMGERGQGASGGDIDVPVGGEKPPVEKPPVEKPPVEKPPVEKPPVEKVPAAKDPVEFGQKLGEEVKPMKFGKRAKIAQEVSDAKLSQDDAVTATEEASKAAFGRTVKVDLPNGNKVVSSVQTGNNQPIFVIYNNGRVVPARATIEPAFPPDLQHPLRITNIVEE